MSVSDVYMGRSRVLDKGQFRAFWDAMVKAGGEEHSTTVGDPPTATVRLEDETVAQYFVAFGDDPEHYYVDPARWQKWLETGE